MRSSGTIAASASAGLRSASVERHRVGQREPGARRAPQSREVRADAEGGAEVVRQRPNIETSRTLEAQRDALVDDVDDVEAMDGDA